MKAVIVNMPNSLALLLAATLLCSVAGIAQTKRLITPEDCVTAKYLNDDGVYPPLSLNPQGTRLAFIVKSPNLTKNSNDIQLLVKDLTSSPDRPPKLIILADVVSQIHWSHDGEHLFVLAAAHTGVVVSRVDVVTGEHEVVAEAASDIKEFSVDADGSTIVFATEEQSGIHVDKPTDRQTAEGYRIPFQSPNQNRYIQRRLFLTKRNSTGAWSTPQNIAVPSPFSGHKLASFSFTPSLRLSLSPDGKKLAFTYLVAEDEPLPAEWTHSLIGSMVLHNGVRPMIVLMVDLVSFKATIPLKTAWAYSIPLWAADGKSFAIVATSPISSSWEQADANAHSDFVSAAHLFWVETDTGQVEEIAPHVANLVNGPLWWGPNGDLLVQTEEAVATRVTREGGEWRAGATSHLPIDRGSLFSHVIGDDVEIVGERQSPSMPPEIVRFHLGQSDVSILARLDSQFDKLNLAPAKSVEWETSTGYRIHGLLFVPPDYTENRAYPLVIQAYHAPEKFFCDYGEGHWPSLAPQPLADAGILYLIRTGGTEYSKDDIQHQPSGYPGGIGEAVLQQDIWDSAVKTFSTRGWVDPKRVGIIGFSHTGWITEFTLSQSKIAYAAATVTDNVTYSLGDYWLFHQKSDLEGDDAMYGGPPYGSTLKNWLNYAPTFNIDRIHTPVLMEEMGYGVLYDNERTLPRDLIVHYELFTGLNRLNRPVEMYYYPLEGHTPDHPLARLASLQRNVDWYRFWLQGYERPNAEDPKQYERWEQMKQLQRAEEQSASSGRTTH